MEPRRKSTWLIDGEMKGIMDNFFTLLHLVHQHFTRQASKGNLFRHIVNTTQYGIRSVEYTGAILWNNLPMHILGPII